jgi:hypothetical protein
MFLHTLKFKGYIGPKTAFLIYMASYLATFYSIVVLRSLFLEHLWLVALTGVATLLNYFGDRIMCGSRKWRDVPSNLFQVGTMALLYAAREGMLSPALVEQLKGGTVMELATWLGVSRFF